MRAGRLRPQNRRGPWKAGREAVAAIWEGSMECEEEGSGLNISGGGKSPQYVPTTPHDARATHVP